MLKPRKIRPAITSKEKAILLAFSAENKKALDPVILDLRSYSTLCDFFVIVSGRTSNQVRSIFSEMERVCREAGIRMMHLEGERNASWVLFDLGDVMVHIFREDERHYYNLERLWQRAKRVPLPKLQ